MLGSGISEQTLTGGPVPLSVERLARMTRMGMMTGAALAVGGSRVADVMARVVEAAALEPDLAVVAVGSNDLTHGVPAQVLARAIGAVVQRRRNAVLLDVSRSNSTFRDPDVFVADRFHPNTAGHARLG